jgi:hypothetical protein
VKVIGILFCHELKSAAETTPAVNMTISPIVFIFMTMSPRISQAQADY